jgi:hypothetical protein
MSARKNTGKSRKPNEAFAARDECRAPNFEQLKEAESE